MNSIILFGDNIGIPQLLKHVPIGNVSAIVMASIRREQHPSIQKISFENDLPLLIQPKATDMDCPQFVAAIKHFSPDLILVNSYSMKLHQDVLDIPKFGCINLHGGRLPEYRGANPIEWSIITGETSIGVTIHYMDEGIDTGDIIASSPHILIPYHYTWIQARNDMLLAADQLLESTLPNILNCTNNRTKQDESKAHTNRRRLPEDGKFTWKQSPEKIYNLIRALVYPHPGAFYYNKSGKKIILDYFIPFDYIVKCREART